MKFIIAFGFLSFLFLVSYYKSTVSIDKAHITKVRSDSTKMACDYCLLKDSIVFYKSKIASLSAQGLQNKRQKKLFAANKDTLKMLQNKAKKYELYFDKTAQYRPHYLCLSSRNFSIKPDSIAMCKWYAYNRSYTPDPDQYALDHPVKDSNDMYILIWKGTNYKLGPDEYDTVINEYSKTIVLLKKYKNRMIDLLTFQITGTYFSKMTPKNKYILRHFITDNIDWKRSFRGYLDKEYVHLEKKLYESPYKIIGKE